MVKHIGSDEFSKTVETGTNVVDFSAVWCGPCKMLGPVFEELSEEISDVGFYKLDVDECPDVAQQFLVTGVPTVVVIKDGKEVARQVGFLPKEAMSAFITANS